MKQQASFPCAVATGILIAGVLNAPAHAVQGQVHYVDQSATGLNTGASWAEAFGSPHDALAIAQGGDEIWVAAGTYLTSPTGDRQKTFRMLTAGVGLYGGFGGWEHFRHQSDPNQNQSILSGEIGSPAATDNAFHVLTLDYGWPTNTEPVTIDGFVVTGGYASGTSGGVENYKGPGIFWDSTMGDNSVIISRCRIVSNYGIDTGGIDASEGYGGNIIVIDCVFENNNTIYGISAFLAGYGFNGIQLIRSSFINNGSPFSDSNTVVVLWGSVPEAHRVIDCAFERNRGRALKTLGAPAGTIKRTRFAWNTGGALLTEDDTQITDCIFIGNQTREQGAAVLTEYGGVISVERSVFLSNDALQGGGAIFGRLLRCNNSVFADNSASGEGGGAVCLGGGGKPRITNCTFLNNRFDGRTSTRSLAGGIQVKDVSYPGWLFLDIENCILWANTSRGIISETAQLQSPPQYGLYVRYSIVDDLHVYSGPGNLDTDPLFVDPANHNYHLSLASPAIDAGDPETWHHILFSRWDIDGDQRLKGNPPDLGADEAF